MFVRLAVNVSMTVIPFYAEYVLEFGKKEPEPENGFGEREDKIPDQVAIIPLITYCCSILYSLFLYKRMMNYFGNRLIPMFIGVIIISVSSIPYLFMSRDFRWLVYIVCGIQGVGLALLLNTATSLISDVIGSDDKSSAFVYGAYSLLDKFSGGFVLVLIAEETKNPTALRYFAGLLPPVTAAAAFGLTYLG